MRVYASVALAVVFADTEGGEEGLPGFLGLVFEGVGVEIHGGIYMSVRITGYVTVSRKKRRWPFLVVVWGS